jgi:hypothetical protein
MTLQQLKEEKVKEFREKFTDPILCEEDCCGAKELMRVMKDTEDTVDIVEEVNTFLSQALTEAYRAGAEAHWNGIEINPNSSVDEAVRAHQVFMDSITSVEGKP